MQQMAQLAVLFTG